MFKHVISNSRSKHYLRGMCFLFKDVISVEAMQQKGFEMTGETVAQESLLIA
jgi:hypothetical protein